MNNEFAVGDTVTVIDTIAERYKHHTSKNHKTAVVIAKFPESDNYLMNHNLYGYEYWTGSMLKTVENKEYKF